MLPQLDQQPLQPWSRKTVGIDFCAAAAAGDQTATVSLQWRYLESTMCSFGCAETELPAMSRRAAKRRITRFISANIMISLQRINHLNP